MRILLDDKFAIDSLTFRYTGKWLIRTKKKCNAKTAKLRGNINKSTFDRTRIATLRKSRFALVHKVDIDNLNSLIEWLNVHRNTTNREKMKMADKKEREASATNKVTRHVLRSALFYRKRSLNSVHVKKVGSELN